MYDPPVDLAFQAISDVTDALYRVPNKGLRPLTKNSEGKYPSYSLRLCNNTIANLNGLQSTLSCLLAEPAKLGWLDLSFNKLTNITSVLCELKELRVLYLHGNSISNLTETDMLGQLSYLHTITLHGNPIEFSQGYRRHVIMALPHLKSMDFSAVTPEERVLANIWYRPPKRAKKAEDNESAAN